MSTKVIIPCIFISVVVSSENELYSEEGHRSPRSETNPKLTKMIKKQLSLRRNSLQGSDDEDDYKIKANLSKLRAAESTKVKVSGLTISVSLIIGNINNLLLHS